MGGSELAKLRELMRPVQTDLFVVYGTDTATGRKLQWAHDVPAIDGAEAISHCLVSLLSNGGRLVPGSIEAMSHGVVRTRVTVEEFGPVSPKRGMARIIQWIRSRICGRRR